MDQFDVTIIGAGVIGLAWPWFVLFGKPVATFENAGVSRSPRSQRGLGIHAMLDLGGRVRFGPDTEYVNAINYDVDAGGKFFEAICRYLPTIREDSFFRT